ncbi:MULTISPECIES: acyl carrier protein [Actinomadura]|uniref:Acyl carrier protein n=1 Tax=Actinomadura litoris TaxID=2678616 RepID=A0A7K1L220_9ACTN|nr:MULTISPECIES: acyl carrier protein [Actinomadura]MBT2208983.1 acyl carrier protein [Actinomadura sp. NEAU-AAG7]MUN38452.1 acyl carrier protein [Actinomadura litoris]
MPTQHITDADVLELLVAVGLDRAAGAESLARSFEDLNLDSLARMEIATRIQDRYDIDVEEDLTAELTPEGLRRMVVERRPAA